MTQRTVDPPETEPRSPVSPPLSRKYVYFSRTGILCGLALIGALLLIFSGQLAQNLLLAARSTTASSPGRTSSPTQIATSQENETGLTPFIVPGREDAPPLQLSAGQSILYVQADTLYLVSSAGDYTRVAQTTGLIDSRAAPPILMPDGQILYSGDGIWMTSVSGGTPTQIARLDVGQEITSMALSSDGKMLAWSTEPANGSGMFIIHAGPLAHPAILLEQSAQDCPCFRIFSFLNGTSTRADTTLLLTDDRGSNEAGQYGLWSLDLTQTSSAAQLILDEDVQQGPLALSPSGETLLYSTSEGVVPLPTGLSNQSNLISLSYANSLSVGTLSGSPPALGAGQVILPEQNDLSNSAQYHWVATPVFAPDARTLAYVEFSSDGQPPYDRHSALYTVSITGSGSRLSTSRPKLLATSSSQLVELGPWLNNHILTIYADGALYALDILTGSMAVLAQPGGYAVIVGVLNNHP